MPYKALLGALTAFLLIGCATVPQSNSPGRESSIVISAACPVAPMIPKESLPISNLTSKDETNFAKISKSYVISVKLLEEENKELREALAPYYNQDSSKSDSQTKKSP